jgi:hypothetical protein
MLRIGLFIFLVLSLLHYYWVLLPFGVALSNLKLYCLAFVDCETYDLILMDTTI